MTTTETNPIDEARLEAFVGQAVTDMGAAISGLLLHIGDRLGLYKAMAGAGPITSATLAARTGTAERYVREWLGNQAAGGYVDLRPGRRHLRAAGRAGHGGRQREQPGLPGRRVRDHRVLLRRPRTVHGRVPHRRRGRLARARRPAVLRRAAALPPRLRRPPGERVAPRAGRGGRQAAGRGERGRRRLRARCLHDHHGAGLRAVDVRRLRHPRAVDRSRAHGRGRGGRGPADEVRGRVRARTSPAPATTWCAMFDCLHDMGDPVGAARHASARPWRRTARCCWSSR